jgi:LPP20 lipoprotein
MKKRDVLVSFLSIAFSLALISGCGGKKLTSGPIAKKAPAWVNMGSGAFKDSDRNKAFYGVGMVNGIRNKSLAIQAANTRARAEIAKILDSYVAVLTRDYMSSTYADGMENSAEEQKVSVTLKSMTQYTLKGAEIIEYWKDEEDGTFFSLAKLDYEDVKKSLIESNNVAPKLKNFVKANADNAFQEVELKEYEQDYK